MNQKKKKKENPIDGDDTRQWGPPFSKKGNESAYFLCINRNKKSLAVNIKTEEGKEIIYDLAKKCDILVENFPTGKIDQLGFGYQKMREINPSIIYTSITGSIYLFFIY